MMKHANYLLKLQAVLKKGVKKSEVEERLKSVFMDSLVGVADCQLVW